MKVLLVWGVSRKIPRTKVYLSIVNVYMYSTNILLAVGLCAVVVVLACTEHLSITQVLDYLIADVLVYELENTSFVK